MAHMTYKQLVAYGEDMGVEVIRRSYPEWVELAVEAPQGRIWSEGVHELLLDTPRPVDRGFYNLMAERMKDGHNECTEEYCEWCNSEPVEETNLYD